MGVPAYFRWLTNSCPQILKEIQPMGSNPEGGHGEDIRIDNLYLDMNGIIHPCSHPPSNMGIPQPKNQQDMLDNMKM